MKTTIRKSKSLLAAVLACLISTSMLGTMPAQALGEQAGTDPPVPNGTAGTDPEQVFKLIVRTPDDNTTFLLPTSSYLHGGVGDKTYDWAIDWGDGVTEVRTGTSSWDGGIPHTYASAGDYTITITPNGSVEAWLGAFGFGLSLDGSSSRANKNLLLGVPSFITPQMTRTNAQIEGNEPAPDYEWYFTFNYCFSLTEAPVFAGWDNISTVGNLFACNMFLCCMNLKELPQGFTFPQGLTMAGDWFAAEMFNACISLSQLPNGCNLPQNLTKVGDGFANYMFDTCTNMTILPEGFNLPKGLTEVGNGFASSMFVGCSSLVELPAGFNMPKGLTEVGNGFASSMFSYCTSLVELPAGFNLPQGLTRVGDNFAFTMFRRCTSLVGLPEGFNLPKNIVIVGSDFAGYMFYECGCNTFQINDEFCFPAGIPSSSRNAFNMTFAFSSSVPIQIRTAASIIGDCSTPSLRRYTFDDRFTDIDNIDIKWGGGLIVLIPGTGDLDGDGVVTMDEVLTTARVAIGGAILTPEQLAVIDMDSDRAITMADVMRVYQMAIL